MKVFVGNLASSVSEEDLQKAAEKFGQVKSASLPLDDEEQPRGFGFVEAASQADGEAIIKGLNGKKLKGQDLRVNPARPERRPPKASQWKGIGGRRLDSQRKKAKGSKGSGYHGGHIGGREG